VPTRPERLRTTSIGLAFVGWRQQWVGQRVPVVSSPRVRFRFLKPWPPSRERIEALDDLRSFHEQICSVLEKRITKETRKLERRLNELGRKTSGTPAGSPQRSACGQASVIAAVVFFAVDRISDTMSSLCLSLRIKHLTAVPEPSRWATMILGFSGLGFWPIAASTAVQYLGVAG
jgi:hypothetical protein